MPFRGLGVWGLGSLGHSAINLPTRRRPRAWARRFKAAKPSAMQGAATEQKAVTIRQATASWHSGFDRVHLAPDSNRPQPPWIAAALSPITSLECQLTANEPSTTIRKHVTSHQIESSLRTGIDATKAKCKNILQPAAHFVKACM